MARKKGAETVGRFWRVSCSDYFFHLAIIVLFLLMIALSSCARGGGTPVPGVQEAGVGALDSSTTSLLGNDAAAMTQEPFCGDGKLDLDRGEQCDREDLGNATCASLSNGQEDGQLNCYEDCTYNDTMCYPVIPVSGSIEDPSTGGYGGEP